MADRYKILFKNGEWLINQNELEDILNESGSDSDGDGVVLNADVIHFDRKIEDSDCPTDNEISEDDDVDLDENKVINVWQQGQLTPHYLKNNENEPPQSKSVKSPLDYFSAYFNDVHFVDAATNTNIYHLKMHGTELKTSAHELKQLYGVCLMMGCISYPRVNMYWKDNFRFDVVASTMSRTRFQKLRNSLHYININETSADSTNLFWKIEPLLKSVKDRCKALPRTIDHYSIDEQMIPYTGRCPAKQFVKNKPRPVGLKNFVVTTSAGLVVDFEIYQGDKTNLGDRTLGLGPAVILHLVKTLPRESFIYFDRYFTTVPLMLKLLDLGYRAAGTIMVNRLKNIKFKDDRKMERGECQDFILNNGTHEITVIKWKDTKCVAALSTIAGSQPTTTVNRWDKKAHCYRSISCPHVIAEYNKHMGGVDLIDQMMEYYRCFIKTKKWTLKATTHFIDLSVVNAWMEYRIDSKANGTPKRKIMDLLDFKMQVANGLIACAKRKRPENSDEEEELEQTHRPMNTASPLPCISKRYDGYDHWPILDSLKTARSCRLEDCKSRTRIRCDKCQVYLCVSAKKSCFRQFHVKK